MKFGYFAKYNMHCVLVEWTVGRAAMCPVAQGHGIIISGKAVILMPPQLFVVKQ